MSFDYQRDTRDHYKTPEVAAAYHTAFAGNGGWRTLHVRAVAARERAVIARLLQQVPHGRILDLPAGTGKLAPVFANLGSSVVACDIAPAMLDMARREYAASGCVDAIFRICDAEQITMTLGEHFDVAVCLRLLHRVPPTQRRSILAELAACADHAIISIGIENRYHRARRHVRRWLVGGRTDALCYEGLDAVRSQLTVDFDILATQRILPGMSQEMIFLLRRSIRT
jgi:2-polyprenyl-3-methyl-5-hydroxy-6-metoxy-1,4-benzoquinol methylase